MRKTDFSKFVLCIEPLKEEKESMPDFINKIFVEYTPYREDVPNIDIKRKKPTLCKYAYGTSDISRQLASDLLKAQDEVNFAEFLEDTTDSISQLLLENFEKYFHLQDLTFYNLAKRVAQLFTSILEDAAGKTNKKSPQPTNVEDYITKVKIEDGMLVFGDAKIPMPISDIPPEDIPEDEMKLKYIYALVDAYNDAEKTDIDISNRATFKKKYRDNFQEQRVNFYEAESLKNFSRDTILSDSDEFQKLLDETYDGVINTSRKNYSDGYDRLLSVLEQVSKIELNGSKLYHLPELVTIKRKCGFCHMLVNDSRLVWVEEEEEDE